MDKRPNNDLDTTEKTKDWTTEIFLKILWQVINKNMAILLLQTSYLRQPCKKSLKIPKGQSETEVVIST
jgi:hypothetical protein